MKTDRIFVLLLVVMLPMSGCFDDAVGDAEGADDESSTTVINNYNNTTIIQSSSPTYHYLTHSLELNFSQDSGWREIINFNTTSESIVEIISSSAVHLSGNYWYDADLQVVSNCNGVPYDTYLNQGETSVNPTQLSGTLSADCINSVQVYFYSSPGGPPGGGSDLTEDSSELHIEIGIQIFGASPII